MENGMDRRDFLKKLSPFGRVTLDAARCTGCGTCAGECPNGALTVSYEGEAGAFRLLFEYGNCLACGKCAAICPEKCLNVERVLEKRDGQIVLFEDELAVCERCGRAIGPKTMLERVRAKVEASGSPLLLPSTLCPECRIKEQFDSVIWKGQD